MSTKGFRTPASYNTEEDFIRGAATRTASPVAPEPAQEPPKPAAGPKPWELANPRVKVPFTLRMDEPLHAKLAYVAERLPGMSMHSIMMQAASEKLESLLREVDK